MLITLLVMYAICSYLTYFVVPPFMEIYGGLMSTSVHLLIGVAWPVTIPIFIAAIICLMY